MDRLWAGRNRALPRRRQIIGAGVRVGAADREVQVIAGPGDATGQIADSPSSCETTRE